MRHFLAKAGLATLLLTAGTATNAEYVLPPGMTGVADFGAIDCATFTHMYPAGPTGVGQAVLSWAQGYIYASSGNTLSEALDAAPGGSDWDFFSLREFIVVDSNCGASCQSWARRSIGTPFALASRTRVGCRAISSRCRWT